MTHRADDAAHPRRQSSSRESCVVGRRCSRHHDRRGRVGATDASLTLEHDLERRAVRRRRGVARAFNDGGTPAVEVGDRQGDLYALRPRERLGRRPDGAAATGSGDRLGHRAATQPTTGRRHAGDGRTTAIEVPGSPPVDSTASVDPSNGNLYFGAGNAAVAGRSAATTPTRRTAARCGTRSSPTRHRHRARRRRAGVARHRRRRVARRGRLARPDDLRAQQRPTAPRRPAGPSSPPTACSRPPPSGDLYGTGSDDFVVGRRVVQGFAYGTHYANGGQLRIYNDHGGLVCNANTNEEIDSSPAVGPILPGGAYGIATGTGSFFAGRQRRQHGQGLRHQVQPGLERPRWTASPAAAPRWPTSRATASSPWSRAPSTRTDRVGLGAQRRDGCADLAAPTSLGAVYGSVTTADFGDGLPGRHRADDRGHRDPRRPDRRRGGRTSTTAPATPGSPRDAAFGFQNAALVTADADGSIGITVAGYFAIQGGTATCRASSSTSRSTGSSGARADEAGGWPQFHHDAAADRLRRRRRHARGRATGRPPRRTAT